ncbi:hypothetical protein ACJMK2_000195 [Sinanodonta woodiana]|uniref:Reverse transcriptase domain-containing protein n=1 Tax=Sinanodonta woodiana TaxID=1069815 RepID=A0ABD3XP17_SINWO
MDFLESKKATIDLNSKTISLYDGLTVSALKTEFKQKIGLARTVARIVVPAQSECEIPVKIQHCSKDNILLQPVSHLPSSTQLLGARAIDQIQRGRGRFRLLNPTNKDIILRPGKAIARVEMLEADDIAQPDYETNTCQDAPCNSVNYTHTVHSPARDEFVKIAQDLGFDLLDSDLTSEEKLKFQEFIGKNRDVFAVVLSELGCTDIYQHKIDTGNDKPVRQRFYRTNPIQKAEIDRQVKEMLKYDIIEPSTSPWQSPVVLVKKKSGEYRFAVDYRKLNKITKPEVFPIPRFDDMMDSIGQSSAVYFSVLDMFSGFWQIKLDPETREKSTFVISDGCYAFKKLPFGLSNSPMSFQLTMTRLLQGIAYKHVLCYIDDVLVYSRTLDEHFSHLQEVFDRLRKANLKLKPSKCQFAIKRVKYLGHVISKDGVEVDSDKIKIVSDFPKPKTVRDLRSFLGLCNYYRRFLKNYSNIRTPLNSLLKKYVQFQWMDKCESAFNKLKTALTTTPVLVYPNMDKPFILSTDASGQDISYILSQKDDQGREHPISYGGRALRIFEMKWGVSDREGLALVEGVRYYRHFLEHQKFTVVTDHAALKYLKDIKNPTGRLGRWSMLLQGFQYDVIHKAGRSHQNADVLSRIPYEQQPEDKDSDWDIGAIFGNETL